MKKFIMNSKIFITLMFCAAIINSSCKKNASELPEQKQSKNQSVLGKSRGAAQIDGVGYYDATDVCNSPGQGASYALTLTGDLTGCFYTFVEAYDCSPSGTYRETGRDLFVGTYKGQSGSFWMNYKFEAKYEGCAEDGSYLGLEIFGRCQHPIIEGSGTGVFEGVSGRMDFKDDIAAGDYPYRGHFQF